MIAPSFSHRQRRTRFTAQTGNYTAVPWDHVIYDVSGGSRTLTLPTTPPTNTEVWVTLGTASGSNTVTISGTVHGNHDSKLYVDEDCLGMKYDGTQWKTIHDGLAPHRAKLYLNNAITTNTATTAKKLTFDAESFDVGAIGDPTTNNRFDIRRAGKYLVTLQSRPNGSVSDQIYYGCQIRLNNTTFVTDTRINQSNTGDNVLMPCVATTLDLAAADYLEGFFWAEGTDDGAGSGSDVTFMTVSEIR